MTATRRGGQSAARRMRAGSFLTDTCRAGARPSALGPLSPASPRLGRLAGAARSSRRHLRIPRLQRTIRVFPDIAPMKNVARSASPFWSWSEPMASRAIAANSPHTPLLNKFTQDVARAKTQNEILDTLDEFATGLLPIRVLGAGRMPLRTSNWPSIQLGKDVFLHSSAPVEWWNEYAALAAHGYDRRGDGPQSPKESASQARRSQPRSRSGGGCQTTVDTLILARLPRVERCREAANFMLGLH
jgi:hypothetical protein